MTIHIFSICQMLADQQLGTITSGTSFADIIINTVSAVADGTIQGFSQFVHDPVSLKAQVANLAKETIPTDFADAVTRRKAAAETLDSLWNFPLNMQTNNTCPLPWTFVEASVRSQVASNSWEFNIMRTIDFIGRNFLKITLPAMDSSAVTDSQVKAQPSIAMKDPQHTYLGAWHSELVPRLIESLEFYTRSNSHKLFEYSGYDIAVHNILFGNAKKEMNDIMAGEDKFELCYDPYRVDGSAMGIASFKGVDTYAEWTQQSAAGPAVTYGALDSKVYGEQDSFIDYFQLDTTMDAQEFRELYRHNVWYEAPVARNYWARHSIHSRRMFHQKKDIVIPLDILPFGYSIGSSLPTAAIATECGFIKVKIFADWLDRCFYLTKLADIPSLHPLVNHKHYVADDWTPEGQKLPAKDLRVGWVNERSIGRAGDPTFVAQDSGDAMDDGQNIPFSTTGGILGVPEVTRENIVPTKVTPKADEAIVTKTKRGHIATTAGQVQRGNWSGVVTQSTALSAKQGALADRDGSGTSFIHKLSAVDASLYAQKKQEILVKLLQVGYQSLPCIKEYFSKLPNIYVTTEWKDEEYDVKDLSQINVQNDLYIQAIALWALPEDANGIRSMRVYPCHLIDHEAPILAGINLINESSQGATVYDWTMLNVMNPAQMGLNPLMENMGLISFSPCIKPNDMPFAFYDTNIASTLKINLLKGENVNFKVNLKQGAMRVICIGVNGVANCNLNCFRLIF